LFIFSHLSNHIKKLLSRYVIYKFRLLINLIEIKNLLYYLLL
jgi:hypothetical protein